jgi:hypothetical protein
MFEVAGTFNIRTTSCSFTRRKEGRKEAFLTSFTHGLKILRGIGRCEVFDVYSSRHCTCCNLHVDTPTLDWGR